MSAFLHRPKKMNTSHQTHFSWRRDTAGDYGIYDGDERIAAFYPGTDRLPERDNAALRPISLHNLRLSPGGPVMIKEDEHCGPLCLSWRKNLRFNMEIAELDVDDADPTRLALYVRSRDMALRRDQPGGDDYEPDSLSEETWLEVRYDEERQSYVYDVRTRLACRSGREAFMLKYDMGGLEFGDILPAGANDALPPAGQKKYLQIVYRASDSQLYHRPQNKHLGPDKVEMFYAPDGLAAFVAEPEGNPVVEFLDGTGAHVESRICWAMYDLHFRCTQEYGRDRLAAGEPLEVHYRFYAASEERGRQLLEASCPDPILDDPMVRCPVFVEEGVNRFEPSEAYRNPSDRWFWLCSDPCCRWDWTTGYGGPGSLAIERAKEQYPASYPDELWVEMFDFASDGSRSSQWAFNRLPGDRDYEVRAMVRTANIAGRAFLAVEYTSLRRDTGQRSAGLTVSERVLTGSNDWTELVVKAACPSEGGPLLAGVFLVLEGKGNCWFDEVRVGGTRRGG